MNLLHDYDVRPMTTEELDRLQEKVYREWMAFDKESRLLDIRYQAIENAMKQSDPFGQDFERLAVKWREIEDMADKRFIEGLNYRQSYYNIERELDRRRRERLRPYLGW